MNKDIFATLNTLILYTYDISNNQQLGYLYNEILSLTNFNATAAVRVKIFSKNLTVLTLDSSGNPRIKMAYGAHIILWKYSVCRYNIHTKQSVRGR